MIKKLIYLIIPIIFLSFSQNVEALSLSDLQYSVSANKIDYYRNDSSYIQIAKVDQSYSVFYSSNDDKIALVGFNRSYLVDLITDSYNISNISIYQINGGKQLHVFLSTGDGVNYKDSSNKLYAYSDTFHLWFTWSSSKDTLYTYYKETGTNFDNFNIAPENTTVANRWTSSYDMYYNGILRVSKTFDVIKPKLSYSLKPIYKDGYISSYGIKVNSTIVNDNLYKYQYAIKNNIDDDIKWVDLYNNNFLNNEFTYITKNPIYFYFRIVDKSNNNAIDSFTLTIKFNLVSPEYDIIFNQSKFYLNGTNYIDRVGISITFKTSLDGLKYQYQYVNDGSTLSEDNWVDTESGIYRVYDVNGLMYARILDNDNNVLYSANFKNTLIGTQDILENPSNFPLYNKVQSVLNFNKGSISDLVLIPVKVLMFMTDSLNSNVCNEYSFGTLLGNELKMPCIDIKSYVGNTIYNFYDIVCSFFISLGIIKLLKNIYMRFMTLEIRDIDNKGGIF